MLFPRRRCRLGWKSSAFGTLSPVQPTRQVCTVRVSTAGASQVLVWAASDKPQQTPSLQGCVLPSSLWVNIKLFKVFALFP